MSTLVAADLTFELARTGQGQSPVRGHLSGRGSRLTLDVDDPAAFAGSRDAPAVRAVASALAARGIVVRVESGSRHLITLGAVRVPRWQRRVTRSRHIRLGSLRGAWTAARSRATGADPVLPDLSMLPPTTMWPLVPTFARRPRTVSTTHDPARGGEPRLVLGKERYWDGERQPVFWLGDHTTSIGSGAACDVRLDGLAELHAVVRHDEDDEFVIEPVEGSVRVHGGFVAGPRILRTGARVELGDHVLAFFREEHADHGRPHGGRIGGELGRQQPQPPRPAGVDRPEF